MTTDYRALCARLVHELENTQKSLMYHQGCSTILDSIRCAVVDRARAALAEPEPVPTVKESLTAQPSDGEVAELVKWLRDEAKDWLYANPDGCQGARLYRVANLLERRAEPEPVVWPADAELLESMPQQFRDDLATVSRLAAHGTSPDVAPGIFRVSLNTGALDYARAVLARWGR